MRVASFFSGIGGIDLGFEKAGMDVVFQCEILPFGKKVLHKHWPSVKLEGDITKLTGDDIPMADIFVGGFPCQDLSLANQGKRKGLEGSRSGLFYKYAALGVSGNLTVQRIEERLIEKQRELISLAPDDPKYNAVADAIYTLRDQKKRALMDDAGKETAMRRADDLLEFVREQGRYVAEYDESLVRRLIGKVTVFDDHFLVTFRSGMEVKIEG